MDFAKTNLFKKFQNDLPVGLCSLGIKKDLKTLKGNKKTKGKPVYPKFFAIDRISPVGI